MCIALNLIARRAINAIFFISPNNNKYNDISESTCTAMIQELADKYDIGEVVNLDDFENFQVQKLRKIYKVINCFYNCSWPNVTLIKQEN
jgi:uncharacterized protein YfkK (UPF0435 family)